ncbi:MAG: hypothetical protein JWM52_267 [Candidatus Saccharibacteria bacterium]|nr:hypothetical protein [Candidatus Saccharibacteria bacterium]
MNILTNLAQYYSTYDYNTTSSVSDPAAAAAAAAILFGLFVFTLILSIGIYVVFAIFLGKIFKKAGVPSWISWVPFYNTWKLLEIGGQPGFWAVLAIVPVVNYVSVVFMYIAMYHIGKKFGKDGTFVLLAIFLPIVWVIWLGLDSSKWNNKGSTAPSLHAEHAA